jgi:ribosomal protein L37AE/L43A
MRRAVLLVVAALFAAAPGPVSAQEFAGAESCKACHPEAYAAWRASKHARALESLTAQQQKDARCVTCHAPDLRERNVASVTCETCHGAGQHYSPEYVMRDPELSRLVGLQDPSEKLCRGCHDASSPSLQPFDFREKLQVIDHWSAERARRGVPPPAARPPAPKKKTLAPSPRIQRAVAQAAAGQLPDAPR